MKATKLILTSLIDEHGCNVFATGKQTEVKRSKFKKEEKKLKAFKKFLAESQKVDLNKLKLK